MKKRGQILFAMAVFATTFIIMFGMVVSIGQLIHAKMNLQNAADLSAMVGASYQARYLNHIGMVNYRMRQNYRFFLFDHYVTQSRFNTNWREKVESGGGGSISEADMAIATCQQKAGYVPMAPGEEGSAAGDTTDMCKAVKGSGPVKEYIPPIIPIPIVTIDPFLLAINISLLKLSAELQQICTDYGGQNKAMLKYSIEGVIKRNLERQDDFANILDTWGAAFADGGVAMSAMTETFKGNLSIANRSGSPSFSMLASGASAPSTGGLSASSAISGWASSGSGALSAYFEPISKADLGKGLRYVEFEVQNGGCQTLVKEVGSGSSLPMGFAKVRGANFAVMVKVTTRPNLLFWPEGLTPTLVAFAAAKPFGYRVSPTASEANSELNSGSMPNMYFTGPGDSTGIRDISLLKTAYGFFGGGKQSGYNMARPSGGCGGGSALSSFGCMAMAPTKYEAEAYAPFPDSGEAHIVRSTQVAEVGLGTSGDGYDLEDRGGKSAGDHAFSAGGGGSWYANSSSLKNAWSPGDGRMGYQIKLISIQQACQDIGVNSSSLGSLCASSGLNLENVLY